MRRCRDVGKLNIDSWLGGWVSYLMGWVSLLLWCVVIIMPLVGFAVAVVRSGRGGGNQAGLLVLLGWSFFLAFVVGLVSVLLGYVPGKMLGMSKRYRSVVLLLLLVLLVLPRYVLYYAWGLLLSPNTALGRVMATNAELARTVGWLITVMVLVLWFWPLAALVMSVGWGKVSRELQGHIDMDATRWQGFRYVVFPLIRRFVLLAFGVCFVFCLSEFTTFQMAGIKTIGTELAAMYELTGNIGGIIWVVGPVLLLALVISVILIRGDAFRLVLVGTSDMGQECGWAYGGKGTKWYNSVYGVADGTENIGVNVTWWQVLFVGVLWCISLVVPVVIMIMNIDGLEEFRRFWALEGDGLIASIKMAMVSAGLAFMVAYGVLFLDRLGESGISTGNLSSNMGGDGLGMRGKLWRGLGLAGRCSIFFTMFLPGAFLAIALLKAMVLLEVPGWLADSWCIVSVGQAGRYAGVAFIFLVLLSGIRGRVLEDMAAIDGVTVWQKWRYIFWPLEWPVMVGGFMLVVMFGMTELGATMILLPPGVPSFAQRLVNQMHYACDQQVIASCLILTGIFFLLVMVIFGLLKLSGIRNGYWGGGSGKCYFGRLQFGREKLCKQRREWRRHGVNRSGGRWLRCFLLVGVVSAMLLMGGGCRKDNNGSSQVGGAGGEEGSFRVIRCFGSTGKGEGEFMYPRAIDIDAEGTLWVVDKTGRIQHFDRDGKYLSVIRMPRIKAGKPTGITIGPDGNIYVADTHYHRVVVFSITGKIIREFGMFGKKPGEFIYPTDVAINGSGDVLVSEYGGNDRISVFDGKGNIKYCFGSEGEGRGEFSRPSALAVDRLRHLLYVADACNHRIAVYSIDGKTNRYKLQKYIGTVGRGRGELRYPYDISFLPDGRLIVCEYGNNRVQLFNKYGDSDAVYGRPGRYPGELAFPWGVAVDKRGYLYIVDAGNNRVQVWAIANN